MRGGLDGSPERAGREGDDMASLKRDRRWLVAFICVFALVGAACGDEAEPPAESPAEEFPAGTTMAELQEAGKITIGVKFDVPPFGFKNPEMRRRSPARRRRARAGR